MALADLLRRALVEHEHQKAVFDLPTRKWHRGDAELDLAVRFHGETASTPLGPAAGPHSQLAQNIVLSWLGGSRIIELKTVQINDALEIPRPCIDATNVGFNVEWSQELKVGQSLEEYTKAWMLLHILQHSAVGETLGNQRPRTLLDMSVGYDLEGIRSSKVSDFMRGMKDASSTIEALRGELKGDLAAYRDVEMGSCLSDCVTLSTFHGCPADEIESICRYLLCDLGLHVIIKMNPTLLGYEQVCSILNERLGYRDIVPIEEEFAADLQFDQAVAMVGRLQKLAGEHNRTLGAKFTNTLVVKNHRRMFPSEDRMYMSGQPLLPIAMSLALRFREAVGAAFPISYSAGIDARNFADAVSCGLTPVTTCTDLLRPGGYGRLFKYLGNLEKRMRKLEVTDIDSYILTAEGAADRGIEDVHEASLSNMRVVVDRIMAEPRYTQAKNAAVPRKIGSELVLFDCISCDKCVPVCPNDANFGYQIQATSTFAEEAFVSADGRIEQRPGEAFVIERGHQFANFADFCNDCGNCDVFCPEDGGPYIEKPRFFSSLEALQNHPRHGGLYIEASTELVRVWARVSHRDYQLDLERSSRHARYSDGVLELALDQHGLIQSAQSVAGASPEQGHVLSTHPARSILAIVAGLLDLSQPNPVNAPWLDRSS